MSRFIEDKDGDHIQVLGEQEGALFGVTIAATQRDHFESTGESKTMHAVVGPVDPRALIEAIKAECEMHEDDEVHDSPVVEDVAEQINSGKSTLSFEEAVGRRSSGEYVHTTPATAEEPRVWAGADEPIIDSLIGRVADLEDGQERTEAHEHLAEHWNRRLEVVRSALSMLPAPGKRGGMLAAFAGEETPDPRRVENALKIARFAADEDRDIPGVDR